MLGRLFQNITARRSPERSFASNEELVLGLEWVINDKPMRALLELLLTRDDHLVAAGLTADEKRNLLALSERAAAGETVEAAVIPDIGSAEVRGLLGHWIGNLDRQDLSFCRWVPGDMVPYKIYCDDASAGLIDDTFRAVDPNHKPLATLREPMVAFAKLAGPGTGSELPERGSWLAVSAYLTGSAFASVGAPVPPEDAVLFPRIATTLFYDASTGAVEITWLNAVVVRLPAAQSIAAYLRSKSAFEPLPADEVLREVKRKNWLVRKIK